LENIIIFFNKYKAYLAAASEYRKNTMKAAVAAAGYRNGLPYKKPASGQWRKRA
jgi:hypothetical protein